MNLDSADPSARPTGRPRATSHALFIALLVTGIAFSAYAAAAMNYLGSLRQPDTMSGLRVNGRDVGGLAGAALDERLRVAGDPVLDEDLVLSMSTPSGVEHVRVVRRKAGLIVDHDALLAAAQAAGKSGNPVADFQARRRARAGRIDLAVPFMVDRARAFEFLTDLKEEVDRAPVEARLDLEHHTVAPERAGVLLSVYESLIALEHAARTGETQAELASISIPAKVKSSDFAHLDVSTVLGTWETKYSTSQIDSDRTYNLKVGAARLDGHVLKPHEIFSFNEVVGDRTEKEGYRVAPVISAGELIDGLAGGMCQIASTLHAASFFAGLDIVSSTPHSRPSAYIPMGLDSTVVYPSTDLKLRNPFDFPIVMHYSVNQGSVRVELLGQKKMYKTVFEREITEEHAFKHDTRKDPEAPVRQKYVAQEGYPGYAATRRRFLFDAAATLPKSLGNHDDSIQKLVTAKKLTPLRVDKWSIHYPATEQIDVLGSGPAKMKKKDPPPSHHIPPVPEDEKPFGRIVR